MNISIRLMTLDDVEQIVAIDQASFSLPWPEKSFRFEVTDNPASRAWVAESDGKIIGMIQCICCVIAFLLFCCLSCAGGGGGRN